MNVRLIFHIPAPFSHDCNMITAGWEGVTFLGACAREVGERGAGETGGVKDSGSHVLQMALLRPPGLTSSANLTLK